MLQGNIEDKHCMTIGHVPETFISFVYEKWLLVVLKLDYANRMYH